MGLKLQRRLAASLLKVGENRVWMDPEQMDKISGAIRRGDIKGLIKDGTIKALPEQGISRVEPKRKKRGAGSKKGKKGSRMPRKSKWIATIRSLREHLYELRDGGKISKPEFHKLYLMAKGGMFKSRSHLNQYIETHKKR